MTELPLCECGCGERVKRRGNRFIYGHQNRGKNNPMKNPDTAKKMSDLKTGVSLSPEHCKAMSDAMREKMSDPAERKKLSESMKKEKEPLPEGYEIDKNSKMATNKDCAQYLGCYIAERVLSKIFGNIRIMPLENSGYDIICDNGYKIDIKSSATGYKGYWTFNINRNEIADYFLCIAFEDRDNLEPIHLWLIPGKDVNHLLNTVISKSTTHRWSKYEQPLDKVIACCNEMRN